MSYRNLKRIASPIIKYWILGVKNIDNLPKEGGCIIAANHSSYLDFLALSVISERPIHFLAAEKFFTKPIWSWLMKKTKQIRVDRKNPKKTGLIDEIIGILNNGGIIGIFPEGTRSRTGELQPAFSGVGRIARLSKCPILPVGIIGAFDAWPPSALFPSLRKKIQITFGDLITNIPSVQSNSETVDQDITNCVMKVISELIDNRHDKASEIVEVNNGDTKPANTHVAFFDVDGTLINGQTQFLFSGFLLREKEISKLQFLYIFIIFIFYRLKILKNIKKVQQKVFRNLYNFSVERMRSLSESFYEEILKKKIFPKAAQEILLYRKKGFRIVLLSNSLDFILEPLGRDLNADEVISTTLETVRKRFTGKINKSVYGAMKVIECRNYIEKNHISRYNTWGYADSMSDIPFLSFVQHPVAINPDNKLSNFCEKKYWEIKKWI